MFFNNCNWCRCWNRCEKRCCNNGHEKDKENCNHHEKKCCHTESGYISHNHCCQHNDSYNKFNQNHPPLNQSFDYNSYEYSNFRYYDQYGSFDKFDDNDYTCNKKHNLDDCKCNKNNNEYGLGDYKPCKPDYNKCQPTKFVCFPVDRC